MATTTQANRTVARPVRPVDWARWQIGLLAAALVVAGLALLATDLQLLPETWARLAAVVGPAAVMFVGAGLALWGWPSRQPAMPAFAVERGQVSSGELDAVTGGADLELCAFSGASQLAVGEFPSANGPRVEMDGTAARLALLPRLLDRSPAPGPWRVAAARGLPWCFDIRSDGGHLNLNLRGLNVAGLRVDSGFGDVDMTLPAHAAAELTLRLALGDLSVTVPEGVEARLRLSGGPLVGISVDARRFIQVAHNEWMTALYPATAQRCTVAVEMLAGNLRVA